MSLTNELNSTDNQPASNADGIAGNSWVDRFADRMNPILVKEVRQAMKSRSFVATFMLLIAACWIVSFIYAVKIGPALEYYSYASTFFEGYFIPLVFAIGVVVPFLAFHSLQNERVDDTFEMLSITTLNARRIVNGKLCNAGALVLLCFSAITPFIAFTSLLQGFRLTPVVVAVTAAFFVSIANCAVGLLASSMARTRAIQGLVSLALLIGLGYLFYISIVMIRSNFWLVPASVLTFGRLGLFCMALGFLTLLCREVTVARITFQSDNRSSGVRLVVTAIGLVTVATILIYWFVNSGTMPYRYLENSFKILSFYFLLLLIPVCYFACTEPPEMSVRVRQQVSKYWPASRFFRTPWLPGSTRGYIYCLLHTLPLLIVSLLVWNNHLGTSDSSTIVICLYLLFYTGIATLISNFLHQRNPAVRSTFVRAFFAVTIAGMAVLPQLTEICIEEWGDTQIGYGVHLFASPQSTIYEAFAHRGTRITDGLKDSILILTLLSMLLFVLNLKAIVLAIRDTVKPVAIRPDRVGLDSTVTAEKAQEESLTHAK